MDISIQELELFPKSFSECITAETFAESRQIHEEVTGKQAGWQVMHLINSFSQEITVHKAMAELG